MTHPKLFLDNATIRNICLIGKFEKTCKYLATGAHGFVCLKLSPKMKEVVDSIKLVAKGDNCPGIPMLSGIKESMN